MYTPLLLLFFVLSLGLRHGLDLDHLATIDAISRRVAHDNRWQRLVGFLFSLGHGVIVLIVSLIIGSKLIQNHFPSWLDTLGILISNFFLLLFGLLSLVGVFHNQSKPGHIHGLKSFLTEKISPKNFTPFFIIGIGGLFALSFDTFTQVSLFSISAATMSGWLFSGILGIVFTLGMMITDGFNGLVIASLIKKANIKSAIFSKLLGIAIAIFSLSVCAVSILKLFTQ